MPGVLSQLVMNREPLHFAAVDIGSNAARLLLANVFEDEGDGTWTSRKASLLRMPVRLGDDVFLTGRISDRKASKLTNTIMGFKYLIDAFEPQAVMACATSAMREAENGMRLCDEIFEKSGIRIQVIEGKREAEIILENRRREIIGDDENVLFIDVGGGSTEITILSGGKIVDSRSFNIGSIRLANDLVRQEDWQRMKRWLKETASGHGPLSSIGSGGNIKAIFGLSNTPFGKPISRKKIREMRDFLKWFTPDELVAKLGLKPDRADVIAPASDIYINAMKWAGAKKMHVPMLGLADGMIHVMYKDYKHGTEKEIEKEETVRDSSLSR